MNGYPSRWVQHVLFFVPYAFTTLTCVTLWMVDLGPHDDTTGTPTLRVVAACNSFLLILYLVGWLGPHYLKLGCGFFNCAVVAYLLLVPRHPRAAAILVAVYIIPAVVFVLQAIWIPSISEIVPGIYLGNRGAAHSSRLLQQYGITHILDLTGSSSSSSRPTQQYSQRSNGTGTTTASHHHSKSSIVRATVYVNDFVGSHTSLDRALEACMAFMQNAKASHGKAAVILIHCSAGQSRSAAFVIYYLLQTTTTASIRVRHGETNNEYKHIPKTLRDVYRFVRRQRPVVDINSDHMAPLRALDAQQRIDKKEGKGA